MSPRLLLIPHYFNHDNVIKWKYFPCYWQWTGALMFHLIFAWINDWVNNDKAGDLGRPLWRHFNDNNGGETADDEFMGISWKENILSSKKYRSFLYRVSLVLSQHWFTQCFDVG